jgi:hypothetical protein
MKSSSGGSWIRLLLKSRFCYETDLYFQLLRVTSTSSVVRGSPATRSWISEKEQKEQKEQKEL